MTPSFIIHKLLIQGIQSSVSQLTFTDTVSLIWKFGPSVLALHSLLCLCIISMARRLNPNTFKTPGYQNLAGSARIFRIYGLLVYLQTSESSLLFARSQRNNLTQTLFTCKQWKHRPSVELSTFELFPGAVCSLCLSV